jgi:hypothetical protein
LSLATWNTREGDGGGNLGRFAEKADAGANNGFTWFNNGDSTEYHISFTRWDTFGRWTINRPSSNVWHHQVVTYDYGSTNNDPAWYIDGVAQTVTEDQSPGGSVSADTNNLTIGNRGDNRCWNGKGAEFCIFNRVLAADEVKTLYYNGPSKISGLVCYVLMDGVESPEPNLTSGGNGTVTGTSLADHPPIAAPFGLDEPWGTYAPPVAAAQPVTRVQIIHDFV